ncbi:hypothetical protein GSI_02765 [Ganoderma sinense ZZ0214-1]|uniref:Uncharacterized protein n=1 Tax=Ganoderma sinense ZZ0214-1 TaxID=1077348 RepID=A0A2G8SN26_9APHY|nr:hypothetical protein GSI_02765 [Ganoderma sinense ZZ0214-1]
MTTCTILVQREGAVCPRPPRHPRSGRRTLSGVANCSIRYLRARVPLFGFAFSLGIALARTPSSVLSPLVRARALSLSTASNLANSVFGACSYARAGVSFVVHARDADCQSESAHNVTTRAGHGAVVVAGGIGDGLRGLACVKGVDAHDREFMKKGIWAVGTAGRV